MPENPPKYNVKLVKNVRVPMRDGVHLSADLIMPDVEGRFPGIVHYHPYRKDDISNPVNEIHYYWAARGYVGIRLDVRGTGSSEGYSLEEYSVQEIDDAQDAINWFAKQNWCTGKLGMFGLSYSGQTAMLAATRAPEPLKAIVTGYFSDDRFTSDSHYAGGSMMPFFDQAIYGLGMDTRNFLPPYPEYVGEKWMTMWKERLEKNEPWTFTWLDHQTNDKFWRPASPKYYYKGVKAATYLIEGWRDGYASPTSRVFENLSGPKKMMIGPWLHTRPDAGVPGPKIDFLGEMLRWWDFWLKGVDTGVMKEPPVSIYVQKFDPPVIGRKTTSGDWRFEEEWPIKRGKQTAFYLSSNGRLTPKSSGSKHREGDSFEYKPQVGLSGGLFSGGGPELLPLDQREDEAYSLNYTTDVLDKDVEVTGAPVCQLNVSSTVTVASFVVRLSDVAPDGTSALVTKGVLNATRRNSFENPEPLTPGKIYQLALGLDVTSWVFEKGHRIRVSVSSSDWPNMWPTPDEATNTVYVGGATSSRITLLIIPAEKTKHSKPEYGPPVPLFKPTETFSGPSEYAVSRELLKNKVTIQIKLSNRIFLKDIGAEVVMDQQGEAGLFPHKPSEQYVKGTDSITIRRKDCTIRVDGHNVLTSFHDTFEKVFTLNITIDGTPFFNKSWTKSVKRNLS